MARPLADPEVCRRYAEILLGTLEIDIRVVAESEDA